MLNDTDYMVEMEKRVEAATTPEAKLAILKEYMPEPNAKEALGVIMGTFKGDVFGVPRAPQPGVAQPKSHGV